MVEQYIETGRYLSLTTPLGANKLLLKQFQGHEYISGLFQFQLEMMAKTDEVISFDQLIGKPVSFGVKAADENGEDRHFNGICIEFSEGDRGPEFQCYSMMVVPKVWMLTQKRNCKIFQQQTVKEILQAVLNGIQVDYRLQGTYEPREFCVQYNETDFDFISRLMEEEGIYYYFRFTEDSHTMVLGDNPQSHQNVPGSSEYTFDTAGGGDRFGDDERVTAWRRAQSWSSGKYTLWDHNFELTDKHLDSDKTIDPENIHAGTITHKLKLASNDQMEVYEYPGNYAKRFDGIDKSGGDQPSELNKVFTDNKRTVGIRMKQIAIGNLLFSGAGTCRRFTPGHKFTLKNHHDADGQYVLVSVSHAGEEGDFRSGSGSSDGRYENHFTAVPALLPYVPPRVTPRPRVSGCQTAKVVGPPGEEIFTDKYGRVKVQFRWDRLGQENASSSCWLRVGTPWAGKNWGMIHIPRVGQEVIVDFMEGDPDRPIVVGSVYNPDQMPPYQLPDNKTQSGIQSRSTKGGGPANYNEFKFEDKMGDEMVTLHAEKDMTYEVENDEKDWVGRDQVIVIDRDRTETVKRDEKIDIRGNRDNKIGGNHNEGIGGGHSISVGGDTNIKVTGNWGVEAGGNISMKAGGVVVIEAPSICIKGGGGFVTIDAGGVTVVGTLIKLNSGGAALSGTPVKAAGPQVGPGDYKQSTPSSKDLKQAAQQANNLVSSAIASAAQMAGAVAAQLMGQVNDLAKQSTSQLQDAGKLADAEAKALLSQIEGSVAGVQKQLQKASGDIEKQLKGVLDEADKAGQEALKHTAAEVANLQNAASQALNHASQQLSQMASQAEHAANAALAEGKGELAKGAQQAQKAVADAQKAVAQAEGQLQNAVQQGQALAKDAADETRMGVTAATEQLNALAKQASDATKQAESEVKNATLQADQMAHEALQAGSAEMAQVASQAQREAQQATQQAGAAVANAEQAAQKAAAAAEKQAADTTKAIEGAANDAEKKMDTALKQGEKQISDSAGAAVKQAEEAGKLGSADAKQMTNSLTKGASDAANHAGMMTSQGFNQVGNTGANAVQGMQNSLGSSGFVR